ncbi:MAG: mercury(II) reductase [Gemmatimonadaceae bacterium]|nr:mercury(II) reductase [Gemmatimonadaceae bacterium]
MTISDHTAMTFDLTITGMTCLDCSRHVATALKRVDGVQAAHVDYRAGRAQVELVPGVTPTPALTGALVTAVERAGYRAAPIIADLDENDRRAGSSAAVAAAPARASCCGSTSATASTETVAPWTGRSDTPSFAGEAPTRAVPVNTSSSNADFRDAMRGADFDLLILGTGGAGVAAAIQAAGMGANVGIVEGGLLGGTCVNVGCIPSKTLMEAAAHVHAARQGFPGVAPCEPMVDWREVVRQKDALVEELREAKYADVLASYPSVARLTGHARLHASTEGMLRVRVGDAATGRDHTARKVIVATGAAAALPSIPGLDTVDALDSTSAMALDALPASMIVLGGGPVGVELGQMFARFGVRVVLVQRRAQLLPGEDPEIAAVLREALEAEGIEIHTGTTATRVERDGPEVVVHITQGTLAGQLRAERVLVATGRRPNTRDLGLEGVGVTLSPSGYVQTDAMLRTAHPDVYAAGDVTGGPGYVYVAAAGGRVAAENALKALHGSGTASDAPRELDLTAVPSVTFTAPQVASVGLTEEAARAAGHHVDVSVLEMAHVPRALVSYDRRGLVKLVSETGSGRVLGVHAVAPNAGEFMGEATLAVRFGLTVRDLSGTLHPYLTWVESLKLAAQGGSMGVAKLSCCA